MNIKKISIKSLTKNSFSKIAVNVMRNMHATVL